MSLGRGATGRLTDDHDGKLDTLPDLVSSSLSGCERHFWFFALLVVVRKGRERVVGVSLSWSTTFEAKADRRIWKRLSNSVITPPPSLISATTASSATTSPECMVARLVASCRLLPRPSRPLSTTRSFATRRAASSGVKTKKKLSELPQAKLLADGTAAAPLKPFNGGLGTKKPTRRRSSALS